MNTPRRGISSLRPVLFLLEGVAMPAMPLFVSVSEAASLPNRCFIDVRSRVVVHGWDALGAYSRGHIAGAQFLAFDRVFARGSRSLSWDVIPGRIAAPLPHISSMFWG